VWSFHSNVDLQNEGPNTKIETDKRHGVQYNSFWWNSVASASGGRVTRDTTAAVLAFYGKMASTILIKLGVWKAVLIGEPMSTKQAFIGIFLLKNGTFVAVSVGDFKGMAGFHKTYGLGMGQNTPYLARKLASDDLASLLSALPTQELSLIGITTKGNQVKYFQVTFKRLWTKCATFRCYPD
jgi:hypothetical protein